MNTLQKIAGILALLVALFGAGVLLGAHKVQVKWNEDKAVREALLDAERKRNTVVAAELAVKYKREVEHAKTQAGRAAINRWLADHGLLPDGSPVSGNGGQAPFDCPSVPDGASQEPEPVRRIEVFAADCADDAGRLTDWQELCRRQGCVQE